MKRLLTLLTTAMLVLVPAWAAGCSAGDGDGDLATDTLTRRQKDSLISTMPIPGSGGVGAALDAQDRLNARTERHDSIR